MSDTFKHGERESVRQQPDARWLALVREQVAGIRFGAVQITVHDGHIVQIEQSEKLRMDRPLPIAPSPRG